MSSSLELLDWMETCIYNNGDEDSYHHSLRSLSHRSGRHFRTKLMSRYIGAGKNDRFDVRMQELVSKAKYPGGILARANVSGH